MKFSSGFDLWNCRPFTSTVRLHTGSHQLHMFGFVISMPYILNHYIHYNQVSVANDVLMQGTYYITEYKTIKCIICLQAATKQLPWSDFNQHVHIPCLPLFKLPNWSPCCSSPCTLWYFSSPASILLTGLLWLDCSGGCLSLQKSGASFGVTNISICFKSRTDSLE